METPCSWLSETAEPDDEPDVLTTSRADGVRRSFVFRSYRLSPLVEYALSETNRPVGVVKWRLTRRLPENLKGDLPDVNEIEEAIRIKMSEE